MLKHDACSSFDSFWKVSQESAGDGLHKKLVVMVTSKEVTPGQLRDGSGLETKFLLCTFSKLLNITYSKNW